MQVNRYIALSKSSTNNQKVFLIIRIVLSAIILIYLYQSIIQNQKILKDLGAFNVSWSLFNIGLLISVIILLPINWSLESMKWRILAGKANISFQKAIIGVMSGVTLDNILPASTGSITGRVLSVDKESRMEVIPGILAGQFLQSVVTFLFGLVGFWLAWTKNPDIFSWQLIHTIYLLGGGIIAMLALYFWRKKIPDFIKPISQYSFFNWMNVLGLSIIRYLVFLGQFILLMQIFSPELDVLLQLGCATFVFAARTFLPKISSLERLGIRAMAAVFFLDLFAQPYAGVLYAVVSLWMINLVIPSLIGLYLFRNQDLSGA
ncbi:MAG: hypothetical protein ABFS32_14205 [Bacteroidota bacterium]